MMSPRSGHNKTMRVMVLHVTKAERKAQRAFRVCAVRRRYGRLRMENLIILGAGGYGRTAAETARAMGVFGRVAFLDDGCTGTDILGPCTDYIRFAGEFRWAYPAFGANALRAAWLEKLAAAGYSLPALVHPRAYVSPTADIRPGAVVLALAAVGACAVVEQGAIVNMGAIADHDCVVGACAHLAPGAIVKAGNTVPAQMKIESGTVLERGAAFLPLGGQHV